MKIVMDRGYCDATLSFCARCSAAFFRKPTGTDRQCIVDIVDDGNDNLLHFVVKTEGRTLEFDLTKDLQEGLAIEGWEFLAGLIRVFSGMALPTAGACWRRPRPTMKSPLTPELLLSGNGAALDSDGVASPLPRAFVFD